MKRSQNIKKARKIVFFCIIFNSTAVFSQDFDHLIIQKPVECSDISFNSGLYYIKYMNENKIDSAKQLLEYWELRCGEREPIFRAKLLLALKEQQFHDSLLTENMLNMIFNYQNRRDIIKNAIYYAYDNYKAYYTYTPPGQEFDKYTIELAASIKENYSQESMEYILAEFYSDNYDTILYKIQDDKYKDYSLRKEYDQVVNQYVNVALFHVALIVGAWIPTGDLSIVGVHPEIGFQMGGKYKKMNYDLSMSAKFLKSPNYYYANRNNNRESTNHFFGAYIGFEVGRDIYVKKNHEVQLTGGIAFDGFDVLNEDKENNLKSKSTASYNANIGLAYRYYFNNGAYIGMRAKYNIVDYTLNNVIDYRGHPITLQFTFGRIVNEYRDYNLKALKYKL